MFATDKDALICDLAETYHIYNYKSLPASMVATLAVGLREDSRIKMKLNNMRHSFDTMLMALLVDRMSLLVWLNTKDGATGTNRPASIFEQLILKEKENNIEGFDSSEDFEEEREKLLKRGES